MSDKNKNIMNFLTYIFRYNRKELSGKERNSLEREFQKDPFSEEASEGFESVTEEEALMDIASLRRKLKARSSGNKRIVLYRIAASVAVLTLLSALFIYLGRNKNVSQMAVNTIQIPEAEVLKSPPASLPVMNDTRSSQPKDKLHEKSQPETTNIMDKSDRMNEVKEELNVITNESVVVVSDASVPPEMELAKKQYAPVSARASAKSSALYNLKGKVLSAEDNMPVPGANVSVKGMTNGVLTDTGGNFSLTMPDSTNNTLIADYIGMQPKEFEAKPGKQAEVKLDPSLTSLNEVVVIGYGAGNDEKYKEYDAVDHTPPEPANGKTEFDKYVRQNLRRPDSLTSGQRVIVVVNFTIRQDGNIDNIKIIRSPGKQFSDEAIRVLKSGPLWKPATDNGKPIDEEVRLRFVFK